MTQIWLLWWPKHPTTTTIKVHGDDDVQEVSGNDIIAYGKTITTTTRASTFASASASSPSSAHCSCVSKLMKKLKRNFRILGSGLAITSTTAHQGGSKYLQCRYDPLSYSLNFDSSGSGCGNLDEDYYHFYAFSSRFVANPTSCPRLLLPTTTTTTTTTTTNTIH